MRKKKESKFILLFECRKEKKVREIGSKEVDPCIVTLTFQAEIPSLLNRLWRKLRVEGASVLLPVGNVGGGSPPRCLCTNTG